MTLIEYYRFREDLNEMDVLPRFDGEMNICGIFGMKSYSHKSCRRVQTLLSWSPFITMSKNSMYWNFMSNTKLKGEFWEMVQTSLRMRCRGHEKYKQLGRSILTLKRCGLADQFLNSLINFQSEELINNYPKMSGKEKEDLLKLLLFSNDYWYEHDLFGTLSSFKYRLLRHYDTGYLIVKPNRFDRFCRVIYAYYEKLHKNEK